MTGKELEDSFFKNRVGIDLDADSPDEKFYKLDMSLIDKGNTDIFDTTRVEFFYRDTDQLKADYATFEESKEIQKSFLLEFAKVYEYQDGKLTELIDL